MASSSDDSGPDRRQEVERAQQLPHGDAAAGYVFAVVTCVVPAARYVECACAAPAGVEALRVWSGPGRHRNVATVRQTPDVAGGSRVPWSDTVEDRHPRAHHGEEAQRIHAEHAVEVISDDKRVALLSRRFQAEAGPSSAEAGEIQPVHGKARRWFRPERPRLRPASHDNNAMPAPDHELHRLLAG